MKGELPWLWLAEDAVEHEGMHVDVELEAAPEALDYRQQAVNEPEFAGAMEKLKTPIVFKQGEEFQKFFDADARRLAEGARCPTGC